MLQYHERHPMRPPNWRWEQAKLIRENNEARIAFRGNKKDITVELVIKFQRELNKCKTELQKFKLINKYEDLFFAFTFYNNAEKHFYVRSELEARILAKEDPTSICRKCNCTFKTLDYFESVFFNVNDRLENTSYIIHQVMGPLIYQALRERDHDVLWKLFGYFCGSVAVDALTTTFTDIIRPSSLEETNEMFLSDLRSTMLRKSAISARTVGINDFTQVRLLETYAKFIEAESKKEDNVGIGALSNFVSNIESFMVSIPWAAGRVASKQANEMLEGNMVCGSELRAAELIEFANKNKVENVDSIDFDTILKHNNEN